MKKILIFSTAYHPFVGGAEIAVKEITDRISDARFDMITAHYDWKLPPYEKVGNIRVHRVGLGLSIFDKFLLPVFGVIKAIQLNNKYRYDIVWSIMASQASIAAAFFKKYFYKNVKLLLTLQEGDDEEHLKRYVFGSDYLYDIFIRPWHVMIFRRADMITSISYYLKKRAAKNNPKCRSVVVANGVDYKHFSAKYDADMLSELKYDLGWQPGQKLIITISRLVKKNAVADIIRALPRLSDNTLLIILGAGPMRDKLKQIAERVYVENRVKFLGHVEYRDLPKYLKLSDVFVRPSLSEGFGNVFAEAMAAGVPVVATPVGGIVDFLYDPDRNPGKDPTGLFCYPHDPASIARQINRLLSDKKLVNKITANAQKMVQKRYDWGKIAGEMKEVFDSL